MVLRQVDTASTVDQRVLSREATECTFYGLTSGCLYAITVTTISGNLSSSSSVITRTSNSVVPHKNTRQRRVPKPFYMSFTGAGLFRIHSDPLLII